MEAGQQAAGGTEGQLNDAALLVAAAGALTRLGALGSGADYWLGICEAIEEHPGAALRAFGRAHEGKPGPKETHPS